MIRAAMMSEREFITMTRRGLFFPYRRGNELCVEPDKEVRTVFNDECGACTPSCLCRISNRAHPKFGEELSSVVMTITTTCGLRVDLWLGNNTCAFAVHFLLLPPLHPSA